MNYKTKSNNGNKIGTKNINKTGIRILNGGERETIKE